MRVCIQAKEYRQKGGEVIKDNLLFFMTDPTLSPNCVQASTKGSSNDMYEGI